MTICPEADERVGDGVAVGRAVSVAGAEQGGRRGAGDHRCGQRKVERREVEHDVVGAVPPARTKADRRAEQRVVGDDGAQSLGAPSLALDDQRAAEPRRSHGRRSPILQVEHQAAGRLRVEPALLDRHRKAEQPGRVRRFSRAFDRPVGHHRDAVGGQDVERLVLEQGGAPLGAHPREDAAHDRQVGLHLQHAAGR